MFINLPELEKTHEKCGLTVNLKSLVGINADKNWLPHYAIGSPRDRGDQFRDGDWRQKFENAVVLPAKRALITGNPLFQHFARRTKKVGYGVFEEHRKGGALRQLARQRHGVAHVARSEPHPSLCESRRRAARVRTGPSATSRS